MNITDVVFDLGRVLIDFQYHELLAFLDGRGARYDSIGHLLEQMQLDAYESGKLTDHEFLTNLNGLLTEPVPETTIRRMWTDVFTPIPDMLQLARDLSADCGVYILSNASAMHWDYLKEQFNIDTVGRGQLASFQAGVRKPHPRIYRTAEEQFGLTPSRTVFIDDLEENAEGARACGWHAIHHCTPAATRQALQALGVAGA